MLQKKIKLIGKNNLREIGSALDCSAFYPSITGHYNFEFQGIPFLRVNDIQNGLVTITSQTAFIPKFVLDNNPTTITTAYADDIIIAKGGNTLAKLGLITNEYPYYALSRDLILLKTKNLISNRYFLWVFLHSKYGQDLLWRTASQTGQPHLTLHSIEEINIPNFSVEFEAVFEKLYNNSRVYKNTSIRAYKEAESLLLKVLNFSNFSISLDKANVISFKESFGRTERLDAEYYQKKYKFYQDIVYSCDNGWKPLRELCQLKDANFVPNDNDNYRYIELANIDKLGGIAGFTTQQGKELPSRARRKIETNDVLISSIEGSLSSCAIVPEVLNNSLCSTGFYVIDSNRINSETLLVLFKSELMQNLLKQNCSGTILTAINKDEFLNLPLPIIDSNIQIEIAKFIQQSFALRAESERLLELSKNAIEIAIEQSEEAAMKYIQE